MSEKKLSMTVYSSPLVPGGKVSEVQASYIQKLEADHIPVLLAYSVADAIQFCQERLL